MLVAFTAGITLHVNGEPQPHTLANSFGNVYMSTAFGTSAERLVYSEVVEFLRDVVTKHQRANQVMFTLA